MTDNTVASNNAAYLLRHGGVLSSLGVLLAILSAIPYFLGWVTFPLLPIANSLFTTLACPFILTFGLITIRAGILEAGNNHDQLVALGKSVINFFLLTILLICCTLMVANFFTVFPLGWFSFLVMKLLKFTSFALMCLTFVKSIQLCRR